MSSRLLRVIYRNTHHSHSSSSSSRLHNQQWHPTLQNRSIFTTSHLDMSWVDKIKGVFTGNKPSTEEQSTSTQSFTLLGFAEQLKTARKLGSFKQFMVGGSSSATMAAMEKHEAIIRYLGGFDPNGLNINTSQKQETAKKLNCSIQDVEGALSKFMWAKEAQKKMEKLKAEGKPMPKNVNEVQELMGSSPMDLARSNLLKTGQVSRNAMCPCGSKKRYKRCCGKDGAVKQ